jgi:putative transposase
MKKTKHTEEKIIGAVKQMEAGRSAKEVAREMGVSDQTLYNWKSKYGGMEVSEAKRLKSLEEENRRLKEIVGSEPRQRGAGGCDPKKRMELVSARRDVAFVMNEYQFSERRACRLLDLDRASYRYDARPDRNGKLREALVAEARQNPRFGYRRLWVMLTKRHQLQVNVKRVHRLYKREGLAVRRQKRKRIVRPMPSGAGITAPNQEWATDFVSDSVASGRAIRALTVVDSFTRECPVIEVATGLSSRAVTRALDRVIEQRAARRHCAAITGRSSPAGICSDGARTMAFS